MSEGEEREGRERKQGGYSGAVLYPLLYKLALAAKDKYELGKYRCVRLLF